MSKYLESWQNALDQVHNWKPGTNTHQQMLKEAVPPAGVSGGGVKKDDHFEKVKKVKDQINKQKDKVAKFDLGDPKQKTPHALATADLKTMNLKLRDMQSAENEPETDDAGKPNKKKQIKEGGEEELEEQTPAQKETEMLKILATVAGYGYKRPSSGDGCQALYDYRHGKGKFKGKGKKTFKQVQDWIYRNGYRWDMQRLRSVLGEELEESDAYDNDRFIIIGNTAKKDNSDTPDNKNHVYAPDSKTALQLYKQGKKVYKEEVLDEFTNFKSITFKPKGKYVSDGKYEIVYDYGRKALVTKKQLNVWLKQKFIEIEEELKEGGENDRVRELLQKQETKGLSNSEKKELRELIKTISAGYVGEDEQLSQNESFVDKWGHILKIKVGDKVKFVDKGGAHFGKKGKVIRDHGDGSYSVEILFPSGRTLTPNNVKNKDIVKEEVLDEASPTIAKVKDIAKNKQAAKIDGTTVDLFTASAISQVYDKVNDVNKKKMDGMKIIPLANIAMKLLKNEYEPVELENEGMETMVPSREDDNKKLKSKKVADTGKKATPVDTEPTIKYSN